MTHAPSCKKLFSFSPPDEKGTAVTPTTAEQLTLERHAHAMTRGRMQRLLKEWTYHLHIAQSAHNRGAHLVTTERLQNVLDDMAQTLKRLEDKEDNT